jgi:50S ribosomal protein L16 3-hydroxylase
MLYLPPHIAHEGIALDPGCQTWSVGFRSPSYKELLQEGLWRLAESLEDLPHLATYFADPLQNATEKAEQLPDELIKQVQEKLRTLKLQEVDTFLPGIAAYLSEPKPQAIFASKALLTPTAFTQKLSKQDLLPHPQTRILSLGETVFCNGENMTQNETLEIQEAWKKLSKFKALPAGSVSGKKVHNSLLEAYLSGWLEFSNRSQRAGYNKCRKVLRGFPCV